MTTGDLLSAIDREPSEEVWQCAIALSESITAEYEAVSRIAFAALDRTNSEDTITAIATCLMEHLFERDFALFESVEAKIAQGDDKCLLAFARCAKFGEALREPNAKRWDLLLASNRDRLRSVRERYKFQNN
jgi:hypothetical protein